MCALKLHNPAADPVTLDDLKTAAINIAPYAHRTPVLTCETLNRLSGHQLFFKCENLQKSGAFKFRGAVNALSSLNENQLKNGVVTHSSGNHAGALSAAAKIFGTQAHIVMPSTATAVKKAAVKEYGGTIIECEPTLEARESTATTVQAETGATMIHPFDDPRIIAGQGTCAIEFLQQVPNLEYIIAPIGGGGLMSGTYIATSSISRRTKILGAEPAGADDAFRSKEANELIPQTSPDTIADGLLTSLSRLTWSYVRKVGQIITVSDEEIIRAMRLFWERTKVIIEPSSAVPLAAVLNEQFPKSNHPRNIGIIISGGNVDLSDLPWNR